MAEQHITAGTSEVLKFWRHLFGGGRGQLQIWTGVRTEDDDIPPNSVDSRYFDYPEGAQKAARWAFERSEAGREAYFCAHLLTERRRIKQNAAEVLALWGDLDGAEIPNGDMKPSAVVESSPGRYHAYWRLSDAIPPETAEQLNRRLAYKIGADPSGFDCTQLLRVPGTINYKYPDNPLVRLVGLISTKAYHAAELDRVLPRVEKSTPATAGPIGDRIPSGQRNRALTSLAGSMRRRGMGEEEILAALKVTNRLRCAPPLAEEEVRRIVESVSRYEPASAPWWVKVVSKNG
jgi:hypothetical protein